MSLSNEIALVTGASRGIGKAIATTLGSKGATVVGTATSASGAQGISDSFAASGIKGAGKVLNVTDPDSIESLIKDVQSEYGAPTILVNNAGIT
ncbi:MAG: SDR family NAD(P)-dependent oxidoreductase, partial [Gammaproteobacteria bacterium]